MHSKYVGSFEVSVQRSVGGEKDSSGRNDGELGSHDVISCKEMTARGGGEAGEEGRLGRREGWGGGKAGEEGEGG